MKKILLLLLIPLLASIPSLATEKTLTLGSTELSVSNSGYANLQTITAVDDNFEFKYNTGVSKYIQWNKTSTNKCAFSTTQNTNNYIIKGIKITYESTGTGDRTIKLYSSSSAFTAADRDGNYAAVQAGTQIGDEVTLTIAAANTSYEYSNNTLNTPYLGIEYTGSSLLKISELVITYDDGITDTRSECTAAFDPTTLTTKFTERANITEPTLKVTTTDGTDVALSEFTTITYSSDNEAVATVDATTGKLTILDITAADTPITITASLSGSTSYKECTASYTLTVTDDRAEITAGFSPEQITKDLSEGSFTPELTIFGGTNADALPLSSFTITYSSDNTAIATVDKNGLVSPVGEGTAVITATIAANDTYQGDVATFTLTVTDTIKKNYVLVTDVNSINASTNYIIVGINGTDYYALSTSQKSNNRGDVGVTYDNGVITAGSSAAVLQISPVTDGYTFYATNGPADAQGYLYAASSSSNHLRTSSTEYVGSISQIADDGEATINLGTSVEGGSTHTLLRYNTTSNLFSCYASGQQPVYIYRERIITTASGTLTPVADTESTSVTLAVSFSTESYAASDLSYVVYAKNVTTLETYAIATIPAVEGQTEYTATITKAPYFSSTEYYVEAKKGDAVIDSFNMSFNDIAQTTQATLSATGTSVAFQEEIAVDQTTGNVVLHIGGYVDTSMPYTIDKSSITCSDTNLSFDVTTTTDKVFQTSDGRSFTTGFQIWVFNYLTNIPVKDNNKPDLSNVTLPELTFKMKLQYPFVYNTGAASQQSAVRKAAENGDVTITIDGAELTYTFSPSALNIDASTIETTTPTTGIESVSVDGTPTEPIYYNLQGVRVEGDLPAGIYIKRVGNKTTKLLVK